MAPIGRYGYEDWTTIPLGLLAVSSTATALIAYSLLIIWLCACCESKSGNEMRNDERVPERPLPEGAQVGPAGEHGRNGPGKKKAKSKLEFMSVVEFNDGKKGRLTKDGTVPHPFTERLKTKQEKISARTSSSTGLDPPPSLHVPDKTSGSVSKAPTTPVQVKKSAAVEKKIVAVPAVPSPKSTPVSTAVKLKTQPGAKVSVFVTAPKKLGKAIEASKPLAKVEKAPPKPFVVAVTVRAPQKAPPKAPEKPKPKMEKSVVSPTPSPDISPSPDWGPQGAKAGGSSTKSPSLRHSVHSPKATTMKTVKALDSKSVVVDLKQ